MVTSPDRIGADVKPEQETQVRAERRRYIWANSDGSTDPSLEVFLVEGETVGLGIQCDGHVIIKPVREWHRAMLASAPAHSPTDRDATVEALTKITNVDRFSYDAVEVMRNIAFAALAQLNPPARAALAPREKENR